MAEEPPQTVSELRHKAIVTDAEITEAVEAYLANPKLRAFQFASGYVLDIGAAVDGHRPAKAALAGHIISDAYRRTMVRKAIIQATPEAK